MNVPIAPRRITALLAGMLITILCLVGCAGNTTSANNTSESASPTSPTPDVGNFPATIDTAYGEITVDKKPERIVALDSGYVELLAFLDEKPVVFASYLSDNEELLTYSPWLAGTYQGEPDPSLFTADYQPSAEAVAAWKPDLILTTIWQTDEQLYKQLSQIAPTYVGIEPDTNTDWQANLAALATLTGHDAAVVDQVQADLDAALAAAAGRLQGLQGKTFHVAALGPDEQLWLTEYANAPLVGLGLKPGEGQPVSGEQAASAPKFSKENVDQLTADVVFVATEHRDPSGEWQAALDADPRVAALPASQNGTLIYLTAPQWNAVNGGSPASVQWWLDEVVPLLEKSSLNQSGQ